MEPAIQTEMLQELAPVRSLSFFAPGIPAPGGSKKGFVIRPKGGGAPRAVIVEAAGNKNKEWRATVAMAAAHAMRNTEIFGDKPISLNILFFMPRPQAHFNKKGLVKDNAPKWHTKKPDATKLLRSTEDAMTGIVYRDDSAVARVEVDKFYAQRTSGARIIIQEIN
jgi:Holliday junction resolvase RusA-like endonuclease